MTNSSNLERYCSQCGRSLVPLTFPHLSAECAECGKTVHFVRTAPDGTGIQVEEGEQLTIPAGVIRISLDPTSSGKLFRPGLSFLLNQFFIGNHPKEPKDFVSFAKILSDEAIEILKNSEQLKGVDLSNEVDASAAIEKLKKDQSRDWNAIMGMGQFSRSPESVTALAGFPF